MEPGVLFIGAQVVLYGKTRDEAPVEITVDAHVKADTGADQGIVLGRVLHGYRSALIDKEKTVQAVTKDVFFFGV